MQSMNFSGGFGLGSILHINTSVGSHLGTYVGRQASGRPLAGAIKVWTVCLHVVPTVGKVVDIREIVSGRHVIC